MSKSAELWIYGISALGFIAAYALGWYQGWRWRHQIALRDEKTMKDKHAKELDAMAYTFWKAYHEQRVRRVTPATQPKSPRHG